MAEQTSRSAPTNHAFIPTFDALAVGNQATPLESTPRPQEVGPIFDPLSSTAIKPFSDANYDAHYRPLEPNDLHAPMPERPAGFTDRYLYPTLTRNERARLTMLWYYTRDLTKDDDLLRRLQDKVDLVKEFIGWEFAICGLMDNDVYTRLVTVGLPLAILPRRESTCAHNILQPSGSVFFISNMAADWRFSGSPHVEQGGLRSYAGTALRCRFEDGQDVALGSLCVASNTPGLTLTRPQHDAIVKFAGMLTEEIVNRARHHRQKQQQHMNNLIAQIFFQSDTARTEDAVMDVLHQIYPTATVFVQQVEDDHIAVNEDLVIRLSELRHGLWEDSKAIDDLITTGNQNRLYSDKVVRAVVGRFWAQPSVKVLVVACNEIPYVFDEIDSWFVDRCASILNNIVQQKNLQEALNAKDRFLRGITHQLRTPIHGVLGSVDILAEELAFSDPEPGKDRPELKRSQSHHASEVLRTIRNSGRELMSTVNNMIKLNRWAEISGSPKPATLHDLNRLEIEILEDALQMMPEDDTSRISIFFDNALSVEASIVMIDMTLLKECLQSLVLNALQSTSAGSVVITISAAEDYSTIRFDVHDTGIGIYSSDHERIFAAYEKADIHTRGAGLGLTLACRIAEAMDGTVSLISSEKDKGSHFRAEFREPGFACPISRPAPITAHWPHIPKSFYIVPSDPPAPMMAHFVEYLRARGFHESDTPGGVMVVVTYTKKPEDFEKLLQKAYGVRVAMSLVPAGEQSDQLQERHPNVMFFSGPFTTQRLNQILDLVNEVCETLPADASDVDLTGTSSTEWDLKNHRRTGTATQNFKRPLRNVKPRCLLVDDNVINLRIIRMYCEKRNLYYETATDGFEAIQKYKEAAAEEPVNLILLDLQMPNCDGLQACKTIREFEKETGATPAAIFIVTGQDSPSDRQASFDAGADEFYTKPMSLKTLDRGTGLYFENYF